MLLTNGYLGLIVIFLITVICSAHYQIKVKGKLDASWAAGFEGLTITAVSHQTILSGTVADQAALHSLLTKIRDLGLPLISVNLVSDGVK
jgi:hypothetical protein